MATLHLARVGLSPAAAATARPSAFPRRCVRVRVGCRLGGDGSRGERGEEEEEAPESLFAKELRRRGMAPGAQLPVEKAAAPEAAAEVENGGGASGARRGVAAAADFEKAASGQRERSMALNSEGLEGLIPRAKLLLSIGSTFFLGFWPLIVITISLFAVLYVYFGPSFVHDASNTSASPPPYVDPYALLEEESLSQASRDVF